jgi:hypothetical protein
VECGADRRLMIGFGRLENPRTSASPERDGQQGVDSSVERPL